MTKGFVNPLFDEIVNIVCDGCKIPLDDLRGRSTKTPIVEARHLAIYFTYNNVPKMSSNILGRYFDRDHSTVLHSIQKVKDFKQYDKAFKSQFDFLEREVLRAITN